MAKKKVQVKQQDRSEIHMLLLGMVAVLAIVGLVLMFNARMATGKAFLPNPEIITPQQQCAGAPLCPDGSVRTLVGQDTSQMGRGIMTFICGCPITGVEDYRLTVQLPK